VPVQRKQRRHWSLRRMECWPRRSPRRASRRLPGGTRRKASSTAASSNCSLVNPLAQRDAGRRRARPVDHSFSVSRSAKLRISTSPCAAAVIRQADSGYVSRLRRALLLRPALSADGVRTPDVADDGAPPAPAPALRRCGTRGGRESASDSPGGSRLATEESDAVARQSGPIGPSGRRRTHRPKSGPRFRRNTEETPRCRAGPRGAG